MHSHSIDNWVHEHTFGQDQVQLGERRTLIVVILTAVTMVVEIASGIAFGSLALLADGLHMASHTTALGIAVFAYAYTRRFSADSRYSFGTGKVNALAGFTSSVLLALFAAGMTVESIKRVLDPVAIAFDQAIFVAVIGLLVNGASVLILAVPHHHHHHHHGHGDHNLRGAYLHVLADSLTSLLAIFALFMGKYFGTVWMDPAMGIIGALLITRWAWGLLCDTSHVLLDKQAPEAIGDSLRRAIEGPDTNDRIVDLHVWSVGSNIYAMEVALVSHDPQPPEHYKGLVPEGLGIVHTTVEVHHCTALTSDNPLGIEKD